MYFCRRAPLGGFAFMLSALALIVASESPSRAEIDAEFFAGAHFFNEQNRLSRIDIATTENALNHSGLFGLRLGYLPIPRLGLEGELAILPTGTRDDTSKLGVLAVRGHVLFNILTGRVRPFVLAGGGGMFSMPTLASRLKQDMEGELHAGAGLKIDFARNWGLRIDGRVIFPQALTQTFTLEGEVLGGFYGRFDIGPEPLRPVSPIPAPPAVGDSDGDGVLDDQDRCPGLTGARENSGCPDQDIDGDEIIDRFDRCPGVAGSRENVGCPEEDSDHDGVSDRLDRCPGVVGSRESAGCPEEDSDHDGVIDRLDRCPSTAGSRANGGCPDAVPAAVSRFTGTIVGITFLPDQTVIAKSSYPVLDQAVAVLKEHRDVRMEIGGHTDTSGPADRNRELSQGRAESVRQYLISKGIDPARLTAVGYGPDKPLHDNATPEGRAQNRRVEFTLIPHP